MKNINESYLNKIINENINKFLLEREMKTSVPSDKIVEIIRKYNFITPKNNAYSSFITAYYDPQIQNSDDINQTQLKSDFHKINNIITKGGWTITSYGNHYSGLRDRYISLQQYDNRIGVGTFIVNIEPEYSTKMDNHFNDEYFNDEDNIPSQYETFYTNYQKGIFYHITQLKHLKKILAHGLKPKNGGGITRWRETSERLYLSLYPDFNNVDDIDINDLEECDGDEKILLKIDLTSVMNSFDFYVDYSYDNAVYTYANIPPQFITVMNFPDYEKEFFLKDCAVRSLKYTIERSFDTKNKTKIINFCKENYQSLLRIVTYNAINLMKSMYGRVKYNENELSLKIKETIKDFLNE
jgi:hypothetical protein